MRVLSWALAFIMVCRLVCAAESLPPLNNGQPPETVEELWAGYDSTREPLEVKVVREWVEDGVTCRYITYTIGTFKGKKSTMAAFYGFPTAHRTRLPGLIQMHGGGQRAAVHSIKYGAQNGYATLSINWGGREMEKARPGDQGTDWGAVDATQTGHNSHYGSLMPDEKTIDSVESPRNNNWFLIIIAAKRGITFLQNQPEVDAERIGAFGHSMGGQLTVMLAGADDRIKAAAPSCGGSGSAPDHIRNRKNAGVRPKRSALYHKTIDDAQYVRRIRIPILYVGPQNDFNGILDNMYANWRRIGSKRVNYTITPHMNHRATPEHAFADILFFEDHLKGIFDFPATPNIEANLKTRDGIPSVIVVPDQLDRVAKVEVYYSIDPHILTRFWRTAESARKDNKWHAKLPLMSADQPLYIMANVYYVLEHDVVGYRWMKEPPKTFGISSEMIGFTPEQIRQAGVKTEYVRSRIIEEDFDDYRDWYRLNWENPNWWSVYTRKIKDPKFAAPDGAKLLLDVKAAHDLTIFFEVQDNNWNAYPGRNKGSYYAALNIKGSENWQTVGATVADFKPADDKTKHPLESWRHVTELGIRGRIRVNLNGRQIELPGKGNEPNARWPTPRAMRNLRWSTD